MGRAPILAVVGAVLLALMLEMGFFLPHRLQVVGAVLLALLLPGTEWLLRAWGRLEPNFRGERIPQSYGLVILLWTAAMLTLTAVFVPEWRSSALLWLSTVGGFGLLGLIDDTWGDKRIKGLRGHFRAALHERKFTTGFLKAVGGPGLAIGIGCRLAPASIGSALLAAALIALGANAINLLDLRPGRAAGLFLLLAGVVLALAFTARVLLLIPILVPTRVLLLVLVVVPALPVWWRDSRAQIMMGDTGSNLLGASLGLAIAMLPSPTLHGAALALLIGLHLLAERLSLTRWIESNRFLRALDRLTGVR
jgi:UDP-GlcNAc:undecaprenyl-phosphate GlcNAc-1-phosphate transferase